MFSESSTSSVAQTTTSACGELMREDTPAIIEASSGKLPDGQKVPTPENPWVSDVTADPKPIVKITVSNVDDVTLTSVSLPKTENLDNIVVRVYKKDTETVSL